MLDLKEIYIELLKNIYIWCDSAHGICQVSQSQTY